MTPSLEETITLDFITSSPTTGAAADADSTPTFEVFENVTDTALTLTGSSVAKRTSKTGNYRATFTTAVADGFEAGKSYNVVASATVGGVVGKAVIGRFQVRTRDTDDLATPTNITAASGIALAANQHVIVDSGTVTTLSNLPTMPTDWVTALGVSAAAVTKIQSGLALAATALSTAVWTNTKAGFLDAAISSVSTGGVSAGDIADAVVTAIGDGSDLTFLAPASTALSNVVWTNTKAGFVDAAITSRMVSYTQPAGFLAATFPSDPADQSLIIAATDAILSAVSTKASQTSVDDIPTNTELATALAGADDATLSAVSAVASNVTTILGQTGTSGVKIASGTQTFNMTGNITGNLSGTVGTVNALAANVITTASIQNGAYTDAKFTLPTEATGSPSTLFQLIMWIAGMLGWRKVEKDSGAGTIKQFMPDATTVKTTSTYTSEGGVDTLNGAG